MNDEFIEQWYGRVQAAVTDAVAYLASLEVPPVSDGILLDWLGTLAAMRFTDQDVPLIARLIDKADPHFQEAGVRLARSAASRVPESVFEAVLTRLVSREIDPWVLEALVDFLAYTRHGFTPVYQGLAAIHGKPSRGRGIHRNRGIQPWKRLVGVYKQNAIQALRPLARDLAYLPILERELGTHGWEPTVTHILVSMGIDPEDHFARLRGR